MKPIEILKDLFFYRKGVFKLKKIAVYTLLMRRTIEQEEFLGQLMQTHWFKETIDLYFDGAYKAKYKEIMGSFIKRGIVKLEDGKLYTTVKP